MPVSLAVWDVGLKGLRFEASPGQKMLTKSPRKMIKGKRAGNSSG
jgi:hypothetical protein